MDRHPRLEEFLAGKSEKLQKLIQFQAGQVRELHAAAPDLMNSGCTFAIDTVVMYDFAAKPGQIEMLLRENVGVCHPGNFMLTKNDVFERQATSTDVHQLPYEFETRLKGDEYLFDNLVSLGFSSVGLAQRIGFFAHHLSEPRVNGDLKQTSDEPS
jgi:hypothetical protein